MNAKRIRERGELTLAVVCKEFIVEIVRRVCACVSLESEAFVNHTFLYLVIMLVHIVFGRLSFRVVSFVCSWKILSCETFLITLVSFVSFGHFSFLFFFFFEMPKISKVSKIFAFFY